MTTILAEEMAAFEAIDCLMNESNLRLVLAAVEIAEPFYEGHATAVETLAELEALIDGWNR